MEDVSKALEGTLRKIDEVEKCYAISFSSIQRFYETVVSQVPSNGWVHFTSGGTPWRQPMLRDEVMGLAPLMVGSAAVHAILNLNQVVEYYLWNLCQAVYPASLDRTWFCPQMVEVACGVKPSTCSKWASIERLRAMREIYDNQTDDSSEYRVSQQTLSELSTDARIFCQDFEWAFRIVHPSAKL